ncbi:MAG: CapA family protein, partial [Eubacteriales bacterium]|nr:CapA family protein [Eubacteriales bacterium]
MRRALAALTAILLATGTAVAETKVYTFAYDHPPQALLDTAMTVVEGDVSVLLTFGGDCTLGGEASGARRFARTIQKSGDEYPLANLLPLFSGDDFTMVNLEGVLSSRKLKKAEKTFNFIGKPEYADILTQGGVECVTLANNHAMDYGEAGKRDTVSVLDSAGLMYCDDTYVTVLEKDGIRIGFTASGLAFDADAYLAQAAVLNAVGCTAIVHTMHMGVEYADTLSAAQIRTAEYLAEHGAALVVGHHPHVAQGLAVYGDTVVAYSLGNLVFGGNVDPSDYDACVLQAELCFTDGALAGEQVTLWPVSVSGSDRRNDYQPA